MTASITKTPDPELIEGGKAHDITPSYRTGIIRKVCIFILLTEMCERLCFYGLSGNMKLFLSKRLDFSSEMAASMTTVLPAIIYVTPLFGGWIADTYTGRYNAILIFSCIYIAGCALMSASAYPGSESSVMFMIGLYGFVGLGSGGIKPNVITLGGDQFDATKPEEAKQQDAFFNYFYWAINLGALVSFGYFSDLVLNGSGSIPQADGFLAVFVICTSAFTLALILFVAFSGRYIKNEPNGSAFANFTSSFISAARSSWRGRLVLAGFIAQFLGWLISTASAFMSSGTGVSPALVMSLVGMLLCVFGLVVVILFCEDPQWVFAAVAASTEKQQPENDAKVALRTSITVADAEKVQVVDTVQQRQREGSRPSRSMLRSYSLSMSLDPMGGTLPADASSAAACADKTYEVLRVMPTLMFSVVFWVIYNQMAANFYSQCCQMNIYFNQQGGSQLNASMLSVVDCIAIIVCIPLFDAFLYPLVERVKGSPYTPLQKIATGFVTAFLAMVSAITIEYLRRAAPILEGAVSKCSTKNQLMSDLSVYWMVIPYFLIGVSECLISVPLYDISYNEVPEELRSTTQAVQLFMTAISGAIAGAISKSLSSYIKNNLNQSHIEYQYYVAAGLAVVALPWFMYSSRNFKYKAKDGGKAEQEKLDSQKLSELTVPEL